MPVGDINSDARGSGARYNDGKPPFELIPLRVLASGLLAEHGCVLDNGAVDALGHLGAFQATHEMGHLFRATSALGGDGWDECARVFDYGRRKYAAWNWAKGMQWSIPLACAARHLVAMARGQENDPESGLPHRGHVFCNIVMLATFVRTYPEGNDLPPKGLLAASGSTPSGAVAP